MKDIYQIINQLITENQELELPEFGKFSGEIMEAEIHPVDHRFMPKYLKIDFQLDKNANGDLIIDKLSESNNISKTEAKKQLLDFRNEILQKLKKGEKVVLKELGYMSWKAGHLYFEQDLKFNYLKESFGLSSFTQKPHQEVVPDQEVKAELQEITTSKSYRRLIFGVAASVVVLALAALIYLRWDGILNVYKNKIANRNDNVEVNKTESKSNSDDNLAIIDSLNQIEEQDSLLEIADNDTILELDSAENIAEIVEEDEVIAESEVVTEISEPKNQNENYYLVAACFKDEQNARDFVKELREKGYSSAELRGKTKGLHRVIYSSYEKYSEALKTYKEIRDKEGGNPWIQKI